MVKIRLKRVGKTKQPSYRVVVADSRSPRDGRIIEAIGHYNPRSEPSIVSIDTDRAQYWIDRGAQTSEVVTKLIAIVKEGGAAEAPAGTPAAAAAPKATPAASVKATPAASVAEDTVAEDTASEDEVTEKVPAGQEPAEVPEAADQAAAAPDSKE